MQVMSSPTSQLWQRVLTKLVNWQVALECVASGGQMQGCMLKVVHVDVEKVRDEYEWL